MFRDAWLKLRGPTQSIGGVVNGTSPVVTIRYATRDDAAELARLAEFDSSGRPPRGVVLVAAGGAELWAAVSLDDLHIVANPLRPTGEVVWRLVAHARQLRRTKRGQIQRLPHVWSTVRDPRTARWADDT